MYGHVRRYALCALNWKRLTSATKITGAHYNKRIIRLPLGRKGSRFFTRIHNKSNLIFFSTNIFKMRIGNYVLFLTISGMCSKYCIVIYLHNLINFIIISIQPVRTIIFHIVLHKYFKNIYSLGNIKTTFILVYSDCTVHYLFLTDFLKFVYTIIFRII